MASVVIRLGAGYSSRWCLSREVAHHRLFTSLQRESMRVLITSAAARLPRELAASLAGSHDVQLTDRKQVEADLSFVQSDLGHDASTNELVTGVDAIVHSGAVDPEAGASEQLDYAMRCTYNLLWAAAEEKVRRFIYLGSLGILEKYTDNLVVTERWRPTPSTEVSALCYHLGEYVCREFAREGKVGVVCLRLGDLAWSSQPGTTSSSALYPDDAFEAVSQALTVDLSGWSTFHIQSPMPNARFLTAAAGETLGYTPARRD